MRAAEIMTRDVHTVSPECALPEAWAVMQSLRVRHLPVVEQGQLVGLLSDREVRLYAMSSPDGRIVVVSGVVGAAMRAQPRVCGASTPIGVLAQTMINHKIDALPVVAEGDGRRLLGIVTSVDLLWLLVDDELQERPIDVPARVGLPGALEARA